MRIRSAAFSLIEVVLALGVIAFMLVGVLGLLPVGMQSFRASSADTRAAQIARSTFAILRTQPFDKVALGGAVIDLGEMQTVDWATPGVTVYADNEGRLTSSPAEGAFRVELRFRNAPAGLPPGVASEVHLTVVDRGGMAVSQPFVSLIERN